MTENQTNWQFALGEYVVPGETAMYARQALKHGKSDVPRGARIIERHAVECPAGIQRFYMIEYSATRYLIQEGGLELYLPLLDELFGPAKRALP